MDKSTISAYNKYHQIYDQETIDFWQNFPTSTIDAFVKLLKGKNILDLGSGPGRDALLLKGQGLNVTCLDASEEMVRRTQELGFESIQSDFKNMHLKNNSFDGVWAYTSLLHVSKAEMDETFKKIYNSLKPNGVFLIGMIEGEFEGQVERDSMPDTSRYFKYYKDSELKDLITQHKFNFEYEERYTPHSKVYLTQIYTKQ